MMRIAIHDVLGLDARKAARDLIRFGMVAVDDISEGLIDCAWDEILDGLDQAADDMPLETERIETGWGPVFVMRNTERVSAAEARRVVFTDRPEPGDSSGSCGSAGDARARRVRS